MTVLDSRLTIQRATVTYDDFNSPVESWSNLHSTYVRSRDVSTGERFKAQEVGAELTSRFTIRYSSEVKDLNPADRIEFANSIFQITGVKETKRNRWLEIDAVKRSDIEAANT